MDTPQQEIPPDRKALYYGGVALFSVLREHGSPVLAKRCVGSRCGYWFD
jgi:hypothetical protein